jgi:hypothetical protein
MCKFDDGLTAGPYDLVVGRNGIQSAVQWYVNDGIIRSMLSSSPSPGGGGGGSSSAIYSGLRITFAIRDGDEGTPAPPAVDSISILETERTC